MGERDKIDQTQGVTQQDTNDVHGRRQSAGLGFGEPGQGGWLSRLLATRAAPIVLWLLVWQLASMVVGSRILLASPFDTIDRLTQLVVDPRFLSTVGFSFTRIVGGFLAAYLAAVTLALVAHRWPAVLHFLKPSVQALKSVPLACVIVLLLIWVGSRQVSGIAVFLAVFPAVYFSCAEGLANVDPLVGEMLETFRVPLRVRLGVHVWPQVLPYLVGTSKNVCGMAWKAGIAAELIGSPLGSIGERIYQSKILLETADLFAWTVVVIAISALCERVFVALLERSGSLSQHMALVLAKGDDLSVHEGAGLVPSSIVLSSASIGYGTTTVVQGVNLDLCPGSRTVVTDASGVGKTTLIKTIAGMLPVLDGSALLLPPVSSLVFQEARLIESLTAVENVALVVGGLDEQAIRAELLELLPAEALDVPVCDLSGGQRRRVEIVRALLFPSTAVLLDEPFSSLDEQAHERAAAFVRRRLAGRTLLVASHDPKDIRLLEAQARTLA